MPLVGKWLVHLADPLGPRTEPPGAPLRSADLGALISQAEMHGVLASVLANLTFPPGPELADLRDQALSRHHAAVGFSLVLRHKAREIARALNGLPVTLVKGPVVADRLYPNPRLRRFTDLDWLAAEEAVTPFARLLTGLGYRLYDEEPARQSREWKWFRPDRPDIMIEVQTDLIHSDRLQASMRLGYADLVQAGGAAAAEAPAALTAITVIHGAGHQFERLIHVVDILQAARLMSPAHEQALLRLLERTGARFAAVTALDLAGRLFGDQKCLSLAKSLGPIRGAGLARHLLDQRVVMSTLTARRSFYSWRRSLYRELLKSRRPNLTKQ